MYDPNLPVDEWLTRGGDARLDLDERTGRNRYGCLPRPDGSIPFGSCTSSTITPLGFAAARAAYERLRSSRRSAADEQAHEIRARLRTLLTIPETVDIALGPSGTDVELLALALAAGNDDARRVMNIVVGPTEVGSGTPRAAACCHYEHVAPSGRKVQAGQPIDAQLARRVEVRTVDLRTARGAMLAESEIDASVIELVVEALERDMRVLLHIVAHSKTGVHAPSLACAERLRQISDDVIILVDAAQGRFSRRGLRDVLRHDYMVMITGSKFYGGPPFSGALLVPRAFQPARSGLCSLPIGFGDYFSAAEMPETWNEVRKGLPAANVGCLLRWAAALAEMEAYYEVPSEHRLRVLRYFEAQVPRIFAESPVIRMLPVFAPLFDDASERLLESKTTVFGFWVEPPGARRALGKAQLKQLQSRLAESRPERGTALPAFQIGQPVELGLAGSVLRIALGGVLIRRVANDKSLGVSFEDRLAWLGRQIMQLRLKIEACVAEGVAPTALGGVCRTEV